MKCLQNVICLNIWINLKPGLSFSEQVTCQVLLKYQTQNIFIYKWNRLKVLQRIKLGRFSCRLEISKAGTNWGHLFKFYLARNECFRSPVWHLKCAVCFSRLYTVEPLFVENPVCCQDSAWSKVRFLNVYCAMWILYRVCIHMKYDICYML